MIANGCTHHAQVLVNRMRVRFRLNEQRVAEMLRGIDPESLGANFVTVTAGLLGCIGDIASLKFMPVFEGAPPACWLFAMFIAPAEESPSARHRIGCS